MWPGEPLHVILTDVPISAGTTALVFDVLELVTSRNGLATAVDTCVTTGIVAAPSSAVTGVTGWRDADAPARRLSLIHGILNLSATALFAASLIARRRKSRNVGRILGALGHGVVAFAAHLGRKMVDDYRVAVDRTAGQTYAADFVPVLAKSELKESQSKRTEHDGVPFLPVCRGTRIFALAETRSHFSGPLSEANPVETVSFAPGMLFALLWKMAGCLMGPLYTRKLVSKLACSTARLECVHRRVKRPCHHRPHSLLR